MSLLSKATFAAAPKPLLWLAGILLLTTIAGTGTTWYYRSELLDAETLASTNTERHKAEIGGKDTRIAELEGANLHEHAVVEELSKRLSTAIGQRQRAEEALADAITQRDRARRERDRAYSITRKAQEANYENDETCAVWGSRPVCGGISDGLQLEWERARGSDGTGSEDGARGDPGPAARPDRPDPDRGSNTGGSTSAGMGFRHPGLRPACGLLLESPTGGNAVRSACMGRQLCGQPSSHPTSQRRGSQAADRKHAGEAAVTFVVLEYPDHAPAARIFDDLFRAGALNPGHASPTATVLAGTSDPSIAECVVQRLLQRGLRNNPSIDVVFMDEDEQPPEA